METPFFISFFRINQHEEIFLDSILDSYLDRKVVDGANLCRECLNKWGFEFNGVIRTLGNNPDYPSMTGCRAWRAKDQIAKNTG